MTTWRTTESFAAQKGQRMAVLVIRHQVRDYVDWKAQFDRHLPIRQAHGSQHERAYRGTTDANDVLLYLEWDDSDRAWLYARSDSLRESMVLAGVIDHPDVWIVKEDSQPIS